LCADSLVLIYPSSLFIFLFELTHMRRLLTVEDLKTCGID